MGVGIVVVYFGVQAASIVPFIGWIASLILMIAYACLPAYIYVHHIADVSAAAAKTGTAVAKKPVAKKVSKPKAKPKSKAPKAVK